MKHALRHTLLLALALPALASSGSLQARGVAHVSSELSTQHTLIQTACFQTSAGSFERNESVTLAAHSSKIGEHRSAVLIPSKRKAWLVTPDPNDFGLSLHVPFSGLTQLKTYIHLGENLFPPPVLPSPLLPPRY
jgi:hypothetical protein